jgi:MoaA/NifB/PqqE/SkfB family radical SAM enzyme
MNGPSDVILAVTHRCNACCVMCNVWKSRQVDRLKPEHMRKLPPGLRTINLTGGEPFLRDDLPQFVSELHNRCPKAQITISTNAYLVERIEAMMADILAVDPSVRLAVSLDGVAEAHDRIRGRDGFYDRAMRLIERLRAGGYRGLRLSMTVSRGNVDQVVGVAELADRLGLELGVVAAHGAQTHLGVGRSDLGLMPPWLAEPFERVVAAWLRSWRPRRWLRAHFAAWTYRYLTGRPWAVRCRAGKDFFFLQADGAVYHCSVRGRMLGNLIDDDWERIWTQPAADEARQAAANCPERCWMICTARSTYRARWAEVLLWIAAAKVRAHLRCLHLPWHGRPAHVAPSAKTRTTGETPVPQAPPGREANHANPPD